MENIAKATTGSIFSKLEDDKSATSEHFVGATLKIRDDGHKMVPEVEFARQGIQRNRPGSRIGRQSVRSTSSRTSMKPGAYKSEKMSELFFCYKENNLQKAVESCKCQLYNVDIDGGVTGSWLLTEIDHWDNEREKIVLLTENSILIYRYNFITSTIVDSRRISLHIIDKILIGDFKYPDWSIMPIVSSDRQHGGIQIRWHSDVQPSFGQRWNPWCISIPWVTLAHHPLIYNPKENETTTFNVDDFYESLLLATSKAFDQRRPGEKVTVIEGPIQIESYANVASLVFNQSGIGFYKDRNGLCF